MFLVSSVTNDSSLYCLVHSDVSQASRCSALGVHKTYFGKISRNVPGIGLFCYALFLKSRHRN